MGYMKIINFGSLNIDKVYEVENFVEPGQTIFALNHAIFPGGKGLNQSVAIANAGGNVLHAGAVGADGAFLVELLDSYHVDTSKINQMDDVTGHATIEVNNKGQNRIIVCGGTNQKLSNEYIDYVMNEVEMNDIVLLQNEVNLVETIIEKAKEKKAKVYFNPSPFPADIEKLPLQKIDGFIVNEIEGAQLAGITGEEDLILSELTSKYPKAEIIMTLGAKGVIYRKNEKTVSHPGYQVTVCDTTAAGDTFTGYYLAAISKNKTIEVALKEASIAAAISVSRNGAATSIPQYEEVNNFMMRD